MSKAYRFASTVVLCCPNTLIRKPGVAPSEYLVLLVKRHTKSRFFPGYHVFPGGAYAHADADASAFRGLVQWPPQSSQVHNHAAAMAITGVRELFEESGVLLADRDVYATDGDALEQWRKKVQREASAFAPMLRALRTRVDLSALHPLARWVTPKKIDKKQFDAKFFLCALEALPPHVSSDLAETSAAAWFSPRECLAMCRDGTMKLAPPTWCVLNDLHAAGPVLEDAVRWCTTEARADLPIEPRVEMHARGGDQKGVQYLALPGDETHHAHPGGHGARHRVWFGPAGPCDYRLERTASTTTASTTTASTTTVSTTADTTADTTASARARL